MSQTIDRKERIYLCKFVNRTPVSRKRLEELFNPELYSPGLKAVLRTKLNHIFLFKSQLHKVK